MTAVANGGATKANGHAKAVPLHSEPREARPAVDRIEEWIARQESKERGPIDLRLVQKGRIVEIDRWRSDELGAARELAVAVYERAFDEANSGFESTPTFELQSITADGKVRAHVPFAVRLAPRAAMTTDDVIARVMHVIELQEQSLHKFVATIFTTSQESNEINRKAFCDREAASAQSHKDAVAYFKSIVETQGGLLDKLLTERSQYAEQWMAMTTRNQELELEAKREERKAKMKQDVFEGMIKPHLPLIMGKVLAGLKLAKLPAAPATPDAPAADAAAPATSSTSSGTVSDAQAAALWEFFHVLDGPDIAAMADALPESKRHLLKRVFDAFYGGA